MAETHDRADVRTHTHTHTARYIFMQRVKRTCGIINKPFFRMKEVYWVQTVILPFCAKIYINQ